MLTRKSLPAACISRAAVKAFEEELTAMNDKALYNGSMIFSLLALLLLVTNVCLINSNRNLQGELAQRQSAISSSGPQSQLNQALVQALAQASVNDEDKDIRDLLASQGISVKPKACRRRRRSSRQEKIRRVNMLNVNNGKATSVASSVARCHSWLCGVCVSRFSIHANPA